MILNANHNVGLCKKNLLIEKSIVIDVSYNKAMEGK